MKNIPFCQFFIALAASLGPFSLGSSLGWSAPVLPILVGNSEFNFTITEAAWAASILSLGQALSAIPGGMIRNRYGTKCLRVLYSIPCISGWLLLTYADSSWMIILGRFLCGIAGSGFLFITPVYIGEIASKNIRGALASLTEVSLKSGLAFSYILGSLAPPKILNISGMTIGIVYLVVSLFLPETPVYLVKIGEIDKARKVLKFLRKNGHDIESELNELQVQEKNAIPLLKIEENRDKVKDENLNENESPQKSSFKAELKNKATRKASIIVNFLFILFQTCGINSILFYSSKIIIESDVNLDKFSSLLLLGLIQLIALFIAMPLLDSKGRKFLLYFSFFIMAVGHFSNGIYFHLKSNDFDVANIKWIPLASMSIFLLGFNLGLAPVNFVFLGELFSLQAKRIFAPMGVTLNSSLSFIVTLAFPFLVKSIGIHLVFYFFTLSCVVGFIFTWKIVPETKGKSLNEIQRILSGR